MWLLILVFVLHLCLAQRQENNVKGIECVEKAVSILTRTVGAAHPHTQHYSKVLAKLHS